MIPNKCKCCGQDVDTRVFYLGPHHWERDSYVNWSPDPRGDWRLVVNSKYVQRYNSKAVAIKEGYRRLDAG
jgi:hypothetical protein